MILRGSSKEDWKEPKANEYFAVATEFAKTRVSILVKGSEECHRRGQNHN